jgi:ribosomal 50S subunit-recycling heat shock protein
MRIDKFLKVSRVIKRRTIAKEACDTGRVTLNGRPAKAGSEVSAGDEITVLFGTNELKLRVLELKETTKKEDAVHMYEVIGG